MERFILSNPMLLNERVSLLTSYEQRWNLYLGEEREKLNYSIKESWDKVFSSFNLFSINLPCANGNPLQYLCLENSMDRRTWWAPVHGVTKSQTWLSNWTEITIQYKRLNLILTTSVSLSLKTATRVVIKHVEMDITKIILG